MPQQPCGKQRLSRASLSKYKATLKGFLKAFAGEVLPKGFQNAKLVFFGVVLQKALQNVNLLWRPVGKLLLVKCFVKCLQKHLKIESYSEASWEAFVGEVFQKAFKIQSYYERLFGSFCW